MFAADGTEHLLLTVKFVEGVGLEHNAFPVPAVIEAEEMPDLVGTFLRDPVDQVVIVVLSPVIFVAETGGRDDRCTHLLAGKAEDKTVAVPEEILIDDKKDRFCDTVAVFIILDAVEQRLGVYLFPADHISHHPDLVLGDRGRDTEDGRDHAGDRRLETGRGEGIPKDMDMHRYILLEWAPINILRRAWAGSSRSITNAPSRWVSATTRAQRSGFTRQGFLSDVPTFTGKKYRRKLFLPSTIYSIPISRFTPEPT